MAAARCGLMAVGAARSSASPASRSQRWCSATPIRTATHAAAWSAAPAPLPHCRCLGRSAAHITRCLPCACRCPQCSRRPHANSVQVARGRVQHSAAAPGAAATVYGTGPVPHKQHVATQYTVLQRSARCRTAGRGALAQAAQGGCADLCRPSDEEKIPLREEDHAAHRAVRESTNTQTRSRTKMRCAGA